MPTFPSWRLQSAIDHIMVTRALTCNDLRAFPAALSDHLALPIELGVPEKALLR